MSIDPPILFSQFQTETSLYIMQIVKQTKEKEIVEEYSHVKDNMEFVLMMTNSFNESLRNLNLYLNNM
jgi:hypothetical protein